MTDIARTVLAAAEHRPAVAYPEREDAILQLRLCGQMAAFGRSGAVALPKVRKTRAVLAVLALSGARPVLRDQLTALLWSTRGREQARASLRQAVHELHDMAAGLGSNLVLADRHTLQLQPGVWVDAHAVARATPSRPEALALLAGGLLEDLLGLDPAFDAFLAGTARRLREGAAAVAAALLERQTDPVAAIAAAKRLLAIAPTHEGGWRALMQAQAGLGEIAAAIESYEGCAAALAAHTQAFPSTETTALLARIRASSFAAPVQRAVAPKRRGAWLGVAAFRTLDPEDDGAFSQGLAEEITTALARFRWINLIAPASIAAIAEEQSQGGADWRGLELDFLLDGTVQRAARRLRVTVRLLDMRAGGEVVWSSRFDRPADDLLTLQDEIAAETVAQLDPELLRHESRRAAARPIGDATAYELMLRAIPAIYRLDETEYRLAGTMLEQAAALAPDSGTIFAWWACWHAFLVGQGWASSHEEAMRRAGELAERAVTLDPACARALSIAGYVRGFVQHQSIEETIGLHERALALNPNLPFAWAVSGLALSYAGEHEAAIARFHRAKRLSPFDPHSFFFDGSLMVPHLSLRQFDTVVALGRGATALNPGMSSIWKGLLSALGHLGREAEAASVRARLLQLEPGFSLRTAEARSPLRRVEDLHTYIDGLRRGGLPES